MSYNFSRALLAEYSESCYSRTKSYVLAEIICEQYHPDWAPSEATPE